MALGLAWLLLALFLARTSREIVAQLQLESSDRVVAAGMSFRSLTPAEINNVEREALPINGWTSLNDAQRSAIEQILGSSKQHLIAVQATISSEPRSSSHIPQRIIIFPGATPGGVEVETDGGFGLSGELQLDAAGKIVSAEYDDVGRNQAITVTAVRQRIGRIAPRGWATRFASAVTAAVSCYLSALLAVVLLLAGYRDDSSDTLGLQVQRFCGWTQLACSLLSVASIAWIAESQFGFTGGSVAGDVIVFAAAALACAHPTAILVLTADLQGAEGPHPPAVAADR